jgi:hypothetical protein
MSSQKLKTQTLPDSDNDALNSQTYLINRAIAMHLLREGRFNVASTFIRESQSDVPKAPTFPSSDEGLHHRHHVQTLLPDFERRRNAGTRSHLSGPTYSHLHAASSSKYFQPRSHDTNQSSSGGPDFGDLPETAMQQQDWERRSEHLQRQFEDMYHILDELKAKHNLEPAIGWAREKSKVLESRGSNLEFELCRLQFVCHFHGLDGAGDTDMDPAARILRAGAYAREAFQPFHLRYGGEIQKLVGAIAFWQNVPGSPYGRIFQSETAWDDVATSFTKEFCSLLGLSADSPLYIAATAGAIALPILLKVRSIMKEKRTEWTTEQELPVEIPLPPSFNFHSIFVCPVSKEQATDTNPPTMLPCGHVICKESLEKVSKGSRFKCPYCPMESHPREAKIVYL